MTFSFEDLVDAVETYPQSFVKIDIIDVEFPDDVLNVDEIGSFKVKVTNTGALNLDNVTLKVKGVNGALVNSGGPIPSGQVPTFFSDFITDEFDRITGHGGTQTLPGIFPFNFQAPHKSHTVEDLIEVTLDGWNGNDDHIYTAHSKGDELVKATFAAKVVKL